MTCTSALHSTSGHPWRWINIGIHLNIPHSTSGHHGDGVKLSMTYTITLPTLPQSPWRWSKTVRDIHPNTPHSTSGHPWRCTVTVILTCTSTAHPKWLSRTYSGLMFFRSSRKAKKDSGWPLWGFHWCRHLQHNRITTKDNNINANYSGVQTANTTCPPPLFLSLTLSHSFTFE